jgi:hypothetical protein
MIKILAAIGLGSALMLAPAVAFADDAAPMAPKPMVMHHHHHHHHHHHMMMKKKMMMHHHMMKKKMEKMDKMEKPKT